MITYTPDNIIRTHLSRLATSIIPGMSTNSAVSFNARTKFGFVVRKIYVLVTIGTTVETQNDGACGCFHLLVGSTKVRLNINSKIFGHCFYDVSARDVATS